MYTPAPGQAPQPEAPVLQAVPQAQPKPKGPAKSKDGDVGSFIQQCIALTAYLKELETQSHLIHLNYEGANFLGVHGFLKDQYESHLEQFDTLAEFIRSMDYLMPMCGCGLRDASPPFTAVTSYKGTDMLATYYKNLEQCANLCKKLEPAAQKVGAIDIANYMADLVGQMFKAAWFVKATLRNA
jgi:DNA-binding ferritin-like protein